MGRVLILNAMGSPPHMRGKVSTESPETLARGITPAHAGKRYPAAPRRMCNRDHPRTCGEKQLILGIEQRIVGSPPHMRGKDTCDDCRGIKKGITPAHAGKRQFCIDDYIINRDHPRTCGEKESPHFAPPASLGSPPHMRGKEFLPGSSFSKIGITPAHAGKRHVKLLLAPIHQDHPRTCGEKRLPVPCAVVMPGSPPHMRGKAAAN